VTGTVLLRRVVTELQESEPNRANTQFERMLFLIFNTDNLENMGLAQHA
jgi:hypothetical protein